MLPISICLVALLALALPTSVYSLNYVAYFIQWGIYGRNYQVSDIPFDIVTHINYAFLNLDATGAIKSGDSYADTDKAFDGDSWDTAQQPYRGNFWQLKKAKEAHPNLKLLYSLGGWTWSPHFSDVAATEGTRQTFAQNCKTWLDQYGFDGIDVDWEYPVEGGLASNKYRPEDGANYNLLLQAIRDAIGPDKLLTIAAPAGPHLTRHLDIPGMAPIVDFINVMTYDYRGGWSNFTGHQTPLFPSSSDPDTSLGCTSLAIEYFLEKGMPSEKINLGAAFYGRGWAGVPNENDGLFQPFKNVPTGSWDDGTSGPTGVFDYKDIKKKGMSRFWDDEVKAPWVYDGSDIMISYDDPESITEKCKYVLDKKLGGIMIWELSGDDNNELSNVIKEQCMQGSPSEAGSSPPPPAPPPSDSSTSSDMPAPTMSSSSSSMTMSSSSSSAMTIPSSSSSMTMTSSSSSSIIMSSSSSSSMTMSSSSSQPDVSSSSSSSVSSTMSSPEPTETGGVESEQSAPTTAPSSPSWFPVIGSACSNQPAMCASDTSFAICLYGRWVEQSCVNGAKCTMTESGFLCDYPDSGFINVKK